MKLPKPVKYGLIVPGIFIAGAVAGLAVGVLAIGAAFSDLGNT